MTPKHVYMSERFWLLGDFKEIVIYPFVFYKGDPTETIKRHALHHWYEIDDNGYRWYWWWLKEFFIAGYEKTLPYRANRKDWRAFWGWKEYYTRYIGSFIAMGHWYNKFEVLAREAENRHVD